MTAEEIKVAETSSAGKRQVWGGQQAPRELATGSGGLCAWAAQESVSRGGSDQSLSPINTGGWEDGGLVSKMVTAQAEELTSVLEPT